MRNMISTSKMQVFLTNAEELGLAQMNLQEEDLSEKMAKLIESSNEEFTKLIENECKINIEILKEEYPILALAGTSIEGNKLDLIYIMTDSKETLDYAKSVLSNELLEFLLYLNLNEKSEIECVNKLMGTYRKEGNKEWNNLEYIEFRSKTISELNVLKEFINFKVGDSFLYKQNNRYVMGVLLSKKNSTKLNNGIASEFTNIEMENKGILRYNYIKEHEQDESLGFIIKEGALEKFKIFSL